MNITIQLDEKLSFDGKDNLAISINKLDAKSEEKCGTKITICSSGEVCVER